MMKYFILLLITCSTACQTNEEIYEFCEGDGICEVHKTEMTPTVIRPLSEDIMINPTADYLNNYKKFPNSQRDWPKDMQSKKKVRVFICSDCNNVYHKWKNKTKK